MNMCASLKKVLSDYDFFILNAYDENATEMTESEKKNRERDRQEMRLKCKLDIPIPYREEFNFNDSMQTDSPLSSDMANLSLKVPSNIVDDDNPKNKTNKDENEVIIDLGDDEKTTITKAEDFDTIGISASSQMFLTCKKSSTYSKPSKISPTDSAISRTSPADSATSRTSPANSATSIILSTDSSISRTSPSSSGASRSSSTDSVKSRISPTNSATSESCPTDCGNACLPETDSKGTNTPSDSIPFDSHMVSNSYESTNSESSEINFAGIEFNESDFEECEVETCDLGENTSSDMSECNSDDQLFSLLKNRDKETKTVDNFGELQEPLHPLRYQKLDTSEVNKETNKLKKLDIDPDFKLSDYNESDFNESDFLASDNVDSESSNIDSESNKDSSEYKIRLEPKKENRLTDNAQSSDPTDLPKPDGLQDKFENVEFVVNESYFNKLSKAQLTHLKKLSCESLNSPNEFMSYLTAAHIIFIRDLNPKDMNELCYKISFTWRRLYELGIQEPNAEWMNLIFFMCHLATTVPIKLFQKSCSDLPYLYQLYIFHLFMLNENMAKNSSIRSSLFYFIVNFPEEFFISTKDIRDSLRLFLRTIRGVTVVPQFSEIDLHPAVLAMGFSFTVPQFYSEHLDLIEDINEHLDHLRLHKCKDLFYIIEMLLLLLRYLNKATHEGKTFRNLPRCIKTASKFIIFLSSSNQLNLWQRAILDDCFAASLLVITKVILKMNRLINFEELSRNQYKSLLTELEILWGGHLYQFQNKKSLNGVIRKILYNRYIYLSIIYVKLRETNLWLYIYIPFMKAYVLQIVPRRLCDPITGYLMVNPVQLFPSGFIVDLSTLAWSLYQNEGDPVTNGVVVAYRYIESLANKYEDLMQELKSSGKVNYFDEQLVVTAYAKIARETYPELSTYREIFRGIEKKTHFHYLQSDIPRLWLRQFEIDHIKKFGEPKIPPQLLINLSFATASCYISNEISGVMGPSGEDYGSEKYFYRHFHCGYRIKPEDKFKASNDNNSESMINKFNILQKSIILWLAGINYDYISRVIYSQYWDEKSELKPSAPVCPPSPVTAPPQNPPSPVTAPPQSPPSPVTAPPQNPPSPVTAPPPSPPSPIIAAPQSPRSPITTPPQYPHSPATAPSQYPPSPATAPPQYPHSSATAPPQYPHSSATAPPQYPHSPAAAPPQYPHSPVTASTKISLPRVTSPQNLPPALPHTEKSKRITNKPIFVHHQVELPITKQPNPNFTAQPPTPHSRATIPQDISPDTPHSVHSPREAASQPIFMHHRVELPITKQPNPIFSSNETTEKKELKNETESESQSASLENKTTKWQKKKKKKGRKNK